MIIHGNKVEVQGPPLSVQDLLGKLEAGTLEDLPIDNTRGPIIALTTAYSLGEVATDFGTFLQDEFGIITKYGQVNLHADRLHIGECTEAATLLIEAQQPDDANGLGVSYFSAHIAVHFEQMDDKERGKNIRVLEPYIGPGKRIPNNMLIRTNGIHITGYSYLDFIEYEACNIGAKIFAGMLEDDKYKHKYAAHKEEIMFLWTLMAFLDYQVNKDVLIGKNLLVIDRVSDYLTKCSAYMHVTLRGKTPSDVENQFSFDNILLVDSYGEYVPLDNRKMQILNGMFEEFKNGKFNPFQADIHTSSKNSIFAVSSRTASTQTGSILNINRAGNYEPEDLLRFLPALTVRRFDQQLAA